MSNLKQLDTESIGTKVGTAIAKGSKATGKGLAVGAGYTGVYGKKIGKGLWAGIKAAGKAVAEEYKKADK